MSSIGKRNMVCSDDGCTGEAGVFWQHWNCDHGKAVCRTHVRREYAENGIESVMVKWGVPGVNFRYSFLDIDKMTEEEAEAIGRYTTKQGYLRAKGPFKKGTKLWKAWAKGVGL